MEFTKEVWDALGAAFPDDEIEFLPRASSGGMALGLPYIDARSVMRRLDAVVGPANWSYDFDLLAGDGKMVKGRLTVCGVEKCDAGEAGAEDEPLKSAVSDAVKRAAVHFNIGRYLYYLPRLWAPYDPQKRRFIEQPRLDPLAVHKALTICGVTSNAPASSPGTARRNAVDAHNSRQRQEERAIHQEGNPLAAEAQRVAGELRALWESQERKERMTDFSTRCLGRAPRSAGTDLAGHLADLKAVLGTLELS